MLKKSMAKVVYFSRIYKKMSLENAFLPIIFVYVYFFL